MYRGTACRARRPGGWIRTQRGWAWPCAEPLRLRSLQGAFWQQEMRLSPGRERERETWQERGTWQRRTGLCQKRKMQASLRHLLAMSLYQKMWSWPRKDPASLTGQGTPTWAFQAQRTGVCQAELTSWLATPTWALQAHKIWAW